MKKTILSWTMLIALICFSHNTFAQKKKQVALKTFQDSVSYAYGFLVAKQLKDMDVNKEIMKIAVDDQYNDKPVLSMEDAQMLMGKAQAVRKKADLAKQEAIAKKNVAAEKKFLAENAKKKGVGTTPSGLQYMILKPGNGSGVKPNAKNFVKVHYEGKLMDGTKFDSSIDRGKPAEFALGKVIKGWTEGLQLMEVGSKFKFFIPSNLGYGTRGSREIPASSLLIFEVELLEVVK